jgi:hypothetical protein
VLRGTGVGASARISRRAGVAGIVISLVLGVAASAALADRRSPNPEELWRAYPLEQKPETTAPAPRADGRRRALAPAPAQAQSASDADPPWTLIAAVGVASALLAVIAVVRLRRGPVLVDAPPAVPVAAPVARPRPPHAAPAPAGRPPAAPPPAVGANGRRAAPRKSPVCQIRWSRRGGWFYAVTIDNDGGEQRLGRSPRFDWAGPAPPEETPDARAALRRLAKDLRERGWRPLRAKGVDFDERRWYCRRFRWPTEAEVEAGGPGADAPGREVAGRPGGER